MFRIPRVGDMALPVGVPVMVPRSARVVDALTAVTDATQAVQSGLDSFKLTGVPVDDAKAVQLANDMIKLEDCINGAKAAISDAQGALLSGSIAPALTALQEVGEKIQSLPNLKFIKVVHAQLTPLMSSVDGLVSEVTGHGVDSRGLVGSIPAL